MTPPRPRERELHVRGATLAYRLWPGADPDRVLVLLHGFASNGTRWQRFATDSRLRGHWSILCPDLRGHGRSVWRGRLRSEDWVADLAAILDAEGFDRAAVGGHCLGANTALHFAHRHPGRTSALVLVEPLEPGALVGRLGRLRRLRGLLPWFAAVVRAGNALGLRRRQLPVLDLAELDRQTRTAIAETGDERALTARYGSIRHDLHYMATAAYMQALGEVVRPLPPLAGIAAPALALLSSGGLFGDPRATRERMAELPGVQLEEIDARHWIPTEQPRLMAEHIDRWLLGDAGREAEMNTHG